MKIQLKRSTVGGKVPTVADLEDGELAINTTDGKLYLKRTKNGVPTVVQVQFDRSSTGAVIPSAYASLLKYF